MPKFTKQNQAIEIHESLNNWANKHQLTNDPYVQGLSEAILSRGSIAFWSTLSPFEFLPQKTFTIVQERISRSAQLLKNLLIFLPVAVTWSAIGKATSAYQRFNSANPNKVSNFLDFWQNGYGFLPNFWKIGSIAALDAIIIFILISLVFSIHLLDSRNQKILRSLQQDFEGERFSLALKLSKYLFTTRNVTDLTLKDSVADALHNLQATTSNIKVASKELTKTSQSSSFAKYVALIKKLGG
jgi:hypothetical protein